MTIPEDRLQAAAAALADKAREPRWVPSANDLDVPCFDGFVGSTEHRTVGPHRAWCYQCSEWCYPLAPCRCCETVTGTDLDRAVGALLRALAIRDEAAMAAAAAAVADVVLGP